MWFFVQFNRKHEELCEKKLERAVNAKLAEKIVKTAFLLTIVSAHLLAIFISQLTCMIIIMNELLKLFLVRFNFYFK